MGSKFAWSDDDVVVLSRGVEKFNPNHDELGRFSDSPTAITGSVAELKAKSREWTAAANGRTLEQVMADAPANQAVLARVGTAVAAEQGLEFRNPGIKKNIGRIREKMEMSGKGPHEITDIVRGAVVVERADQADAVVRGFAKRFPTIDEGWRKTDDGYVDRPLKVEA